MTKLQLLHRALNERLMAAVEQIMEMVGGTVLEYEEETIRARKENEVLRRRLRWMQGANPADWPGPSEPITLSTQDESNPSQQGDCAVNFGSGQESEGLVIKTETTDHPLYSASTLPQRTDQGSDIAGTSTGITYGLADGMTWDSAQSYMAPLDFDPTSGSTRVRHWRGQNRRQRMSFACPDCGKVFGKEQRLMIHMRIHSTERPYKYRRRKAFFYGDNKKKRKLHSLSQLSREIVEELSDCSEQTSRSSASPKRLAPDREEEPGGITSDSDHTSSDKEPENRATVRDRRKKKTEETQMQCRCPHCPNRVFARPCQLAMHMKTHTSPNQAQSGTVEIMDVKMKSPPKQRKNVAVKKAKDADKSDFHCPKCDKVFAFAAKLRVHMKSHRTEALSRRSLKMSILAEISKEETMEVVPKTTEGQVLQELKKKYACPHCDKVFIREGWLEPHIRSQHRKVKKRCNPRGVILDSRQTRSHQPYYQQLRKRTAEKQGASVESKKVNDKPKSIDDSNPVVTGYTQHLRKRTAEKQAVTKELKQNNEVSKKVNAKPSPSIDESNLVVAGYTQQLRKRTTETRGVTKELEQKNKESKKVNAKPRLSSGESNLVVDVLKITTDEAEKSPDLPKRSTDESMCTPEQTTDTSVSKRKAKFNPPKRFPCKVCGKAFVGEKKLRKHKRKHMVRRWLNEKKRKFEEALGETELMEQVGKRQKEAKEMLDDKTSTSNRNSNTQTPRGSPNKELQKGKTRGQGPLPCPFCGKVFAWEMRLLMHMQIHCGEKPYSYRQREKRFYGDLKRGQLPKIHNQEPPGNNSDKSEESAGEETVNEDGSAHLSSSTTHAVSGTLTSSTETTGMDDCTDSVCLLPQTTIKQLTTCNKSNQTVKPELFSDIMSHFSLQPRIVLEPIMTECKYWRSVSGDLKYSHSERSGFDHEKPSSSVLVDEDAVEDTIVGSNRCDSVIPETEIVPIEFGSPQRDSPSEIELYNFDSLGVESTEGNNTESQQKEDHDCYFPGFSEKKVINQVPLIIIDDELEQQNTRTAANHAPSDCGRIKCDSKCDCTNVSAMKLTVMPQTSDLRSLFKETISGAMQKKIDSELVCVILSDAEDDVDEDVLMCSPKELDKKKTASVPSFENEQLDVDSKPGEDPSSYSSFPALNPIDATESKTESTCVHVKSIDGTFKHTGVQVVTSERNDQSLLNDSLTRDQSDSIAIRQTEDVPMNLIEERPFQTTENPSSDSSFPASDATESKNDESTCVHVESIDGTFKHTGVQVVTSERNDQSILNDPLTGDQIDSFANRQTEDDPMNSMEERPFQTSENPSSDSSFSAPNANESFKTDESTCVHVQSIDRTSKHTDDQSISNDSLTRDQMPSITIMQTEDNRMNSMEEISCQTSDAVFAGQACLSEVNADKKLVDMEIFSGIERKKKLFEQAESVLDDSTDN
ncbi:uncharacterized protein zgc:66474 isoform X3 [Pseudorasbora parva]|uniref:uncharacterized protein zgc:66474 isoform X3 n=1 Tax=Pseudorasbora parva TaxID=51549 RepID=UPI00351F383C